MISTDLLSILLHNVNDLEYYQFVVRDFRREFSRDMPKKYRIFPTQPRIYVLSNTICIEMPAWGSIKYRDKLCSLEKRLRHIFQIDTVFYDGKITYIIKENRKCGQK